MNNYDMVFNNALLSADTPASEELNIFRLEILSADREAIVDTDVYIFDGDELISIKKTDEEGKVTFELPLVEYEIRIGNISSEAQTIVASEEIQTVALPGANEAKIEWSPENLGEAAGYMGVGMLGVFLIVGIIMGATYAINAIINKLASKKKDSE